MRNEKNREKKGLPHFVAWLDGRKQGLGHNKHSKCHVKFKQTMGVEGGGEEGSAEYLNSKWTTLYLFIIIIIIIINSLLIYNIINKTNDPIVWYHNKQTNYPKVKYHIWSNDPKANIITSLTTTLLQK